MPSIPLNNWIQDKWPLLALLCTLFMLILYRYRPSERRTVAGTLFFAAIASSMQFIAINTTILGIDYAAPILNEAAIVLFGMISIYVLALVFFRLFLPLTPIQPPRILEDILVFAGFIVWIIIRLHHAGVNPSNLVTMSALLTAVVAFAMQDTLGNVLSGIFLQLDSSLQLGQLIAVDKISGTVMQIGWRSTLIRMPTGTLLVMPNASLMKNSFQIIGKQFGQQEGVLQQSLSFELSWNHPPSVVIGVLQSATVGARIATIASTPSPAAFLVDIRDGIARYILRYWLNDANADEATDSKLRSNIMMALIRNNLPLAVKNPESMDKHQTEESIKKRRAALEGLTLFSRLSPDELEHLAELLIFAPFEAGNIVSHQGSVATCLYILARGEVDVWLDFHQGSPKLLGHLSKGSFFGEMGLMTGEARTATIVANTYVECFRLDKDTFHAIISARPEIADEISEILAQRLEENRRNAIGAQESRASLQAELLVRIRRFFNLG